MPVLWLCQLRAKGLQRLRLQVSELEVYRFWGLGFRNLGVVGFSVQGPQGELQGHLRAELKVLGSSRPEPYTLNPDPQP